MERLRSWYFEPQTQLTPRARRWYAIQLYSLPLAGVVHASLIPLVAMLGSRVLVGFNVGSVVLYALAAIACRTGRDRLAYWMMGAEVTAHAIVSVQQFGWAAGFQNALFLLALVNGPHADRSDRLTLSAIGVAASIYGYRMGPPEIVLSPVTSTFLFSVNVLVVFAMTATVLAVLEGTASGLERDLATERARSEELLKRELSHQVAERSRELGAVLAKSGVTLDVRALEAGQRFAERYRVVAPLGAGGMGAVYEVERVTDGKKLALKAVVGEVSGASAARFAREAEIGARVGHPNLISIVDVGVSAGVPFLAMELVTGGSLEARRSKFGDVTWALPILEQVAQGLVALHDAGVVHRDLKPANVLLADDGVAKISDFGISRFGAFDDSASIDSAAATMAATPKKSAELTGTGVVMGTPLYMAPEGAMPAPTCSRSASSRTRCSPVEARSPYPRSRSRWRSSRSPCPRRSTTRASRLRSPRSCSRASPAIRGGVRGRAPSSPCSRRS